MTDNRYTGWRTSTRSGSNPGDCVEVGRSPDGGAGVRDSKDRHGPVLEFSSGEWASFVEALRDGRLGRQGSGY